MVVASSLVGRVILLGALVSCQQTNAHLAPLSSPQQPGPALAESVEWHRVGLSVGAALFADFETEIRVDSATLGRGSKIALEDGLDLDSDTEIGRADGFYRFNRKHRIDASYFNIERDSTLTINQQLQIGDAVFPINTSVNATFGSLKGFRD